MHADHDMHADHGYSRQWSISIPYIVCSTNSYRSNSWASCLPFYFRALMSVHNRIQPVWSFIIY